MPGSAIMSDKLRRIALLAPIETAGVRQTICRFQQVAGALGIEAQHFSKSEAILDFEPDCVLALSCQDAKLTPFPTYGILTGPVSSYLRTRRFVRNILTYDAYLTFSREVQTWLRDITFGSRKFSAPMGAYMHSVPATEFQPSTTATPKLAHIGTNCDPGRFIPLLRELAVGEEIEVYGPPGWWTGLPSAVCRGPVPADGDSALQVYRLAGVGLDLHPTGCSLDLPPTIRSLEIIASSAVAITPRHPFLESVFGDALLYFDAELPPGDAARQVRDHMRWIRANPGAALEKARRAHRVFRHNLAQECFLPALFELHARVLVEKGYQPDPDPAKEADLPSVTYIMRTGGGRPLHLLRRALDSLQSQRYPGLTVLFVLFRPFPELDSIRRQYPGLRARVVTDFGGLRSSAICAGMRHVDTDYFGLLDDDDMMHPNHVRMLVKALRYHNGRNWRGQVRMAYSGSVEVSDSEPRLEQPEYEDAYALVRRELRALEHYRFYNSGAMSQHSWYLINSWLAHKSLLDEELLNDPRIHTCEDLHVALQFAQKTFLAFSGEVTTNHCFHGHGNSTIQDADRHLSDTLRIATRMWARQFPVEAGYYLRFLPLGRQERWKPDHSAGVGVNVIGRLALPDPARLGGRKQGRVILDQDDPDSLRLRAQPMMLDPGAYTLSIQFEPLQEPAASEAVWIEIELFVCGPDGEETLGRAGYGRSDLAAHGDLFHADIKFLLENAKQPRPVAFVFGRNPALRLDLRRVMLSATALEETVLAHAVAAS